MKTKMFIFFALIGVLAYQCSRSSESPEELELAAFGMASYNSEEKVLRIYDEQTHEMREYMTTYLRFGFGREGVEWKDSVYLYLYGTSLKGVVANLSREDALKLEAVAKEISKGAFFSSLWFWVLPLGCLLYLWLGGILGKWPLGVSKFRFILVALPFFGGILSVQWFGKIFPDAGLMSAVLSGSAQDVPAAKYFEAEVLGNCHAYLSLYVMLCLGVIAVVSLLRGVMAKCRMQRTIGQLLFVAAAMGLRDNFEKMSQEEQEKVYALMPQIAEIARPAAKVLYEMLPLMQEDVRERFFKELVALPEKLKVVALESYVARYAEVIGKLLEQFCACCKDCAESKG